MLGLKSLENVVLMVYGNFLSFNDKEAKVYYNVDSVKTELLTLSFVLYPLPIQEQEGILKNLYFTKNELNEL